MTGLTISDFLYVLVYFTVMPGFLAKCERAVFFPSTTKIRLEPRYKTDVQARQEKGDSTE